MPRLMPFLGIVFFLIIQITLCAQSRNGYKINGITVAGGNGRGDAGNQFAGASSIFIDRAGNLYVLDIFNYRVQKWTPGATSGFPVAGAHDNGTAANQIDFANGIFVDSKGNVYVADENNHRIQKWPPGAITAVTVAGGQGSNPVYPNGIFIDSVQNMYILEGGIGRVQKWPPHGTRGVTVAGGNGIGASSNQLNSPASMFIDKTGNIYIADTQNNRVQKWAPHSSEGVTVAGGNGQGNEANQLFWPLGVFVDPVGNVYVADQFNNRIQKWPPGATEGITVAGGNARRGNAPDQLNHPFGIFLDAAGNIYVSDSNERVQKFERDDITPYEPKENLNSISKTVLNQEKTANFSPGQVIFTSLNWLEPVSNLDRLPDGVYNSIIASIPLVVRISSTASIDALKIKVLLNGNVLSRGNKMRVVDLKILKTPSGTNKKYEYLFSSTVIVPKGKSILQVTYGDDGTDVLPVYYTPKGLNLYILAVGPTAAGLRYPQKDALDFAGLFRQNQQGDGKLFQLVNIDTLTGESAKAATIADKIYELGVKEYGPNDVLFIFLSSHGFIEEKKLKITGSDYKASESNLTSLDFNENILAPLQSANCKKFIFLDACQSGAGIKAAPVDISNAIQKMINADNSITIITSSSGDEQSWEDPIWQNGAFTKAIKDAFADKRCDINGDGIISIDELFAYLKKRVPELVKNSGKTDDGHHAVTQNPKMYNARGDVGIFVY